MTSEQKSNTPEQPSGGQRVPYAVGSWQESPQKYLERYPDSLWRVYSKGYPQYQADTVYRGASLQLFFAALQREDAVENELVLFHVMEEDDALAMVAFRRDTIVFGVPPPYPGSVVPCGDGVDCARDPYNEDDEFCHDCWGGEDKWFQRKFFPDRSGKMILEHMAEDSKCVTTTILQLHDKNVQAHRDEKARLEAKIEAEAKKKAQLQAQRVLMTMELVQLQTELDALNAALVVKNAKMQALREALRWPTAYGARWPTAYGTR